MTFSFHPAARDEVDQAVDYYEKCEPGLGSEFLEEIYSTIARAVEYPKAWSRLSAKSGGAWHSDSRIP